jgi:hypothetical protein
MAIGMSAVALAATSYTKELPGQVIIVAPLYSMEVFSDSGCTSVVTSIDLGSLYPGDTFSKTVYVKNVGQIHFAKVNLSFIIGGIGTATLTPNSFALAVGNIQQVDLNITILSIATPGTYSNLVMKFQITY